jgi:hypothetical protein
LAKIADGNFRGAGVSARIGAGLRAPGKGVTFAGAA